MSDGFSVGRRGALAAISGAALTAAIVPTSGSLAKGRKAPLDFAKPADRFKAFMLMRGALDDRLVIGCISGSYYGVIDAEMTPLFGVSAATFTRFRPSADGGYEAVTAEQAYFTDLATGEWVQSVINPYTGETINPPASGYPASKIRFTPDMELKIERAMPGVKFDHAVAPVEVRGDDVWFTETTHTEGAVPGANKPFRYSETVILHARRSDLEQSGVKRVACDTTFNGVVSWRPWMKMGDRPGHLLAVGAGQYGATLDTLPPAWINATRKHRPDLLANPQSILDALWNTKS